MVLGSDSQSFRGRECHKREKRCSTDACPYFCRVFSFPSFFLPLSLLFVLQFLVSFLLFSPSLPLSLLFCSRLPLFPFILFDSMGFLPFVPKASPIVFGFFVGIFLRFPTNLLVTGPLSLLRACLLHHSPFPDKIPCFVSPPFQFLPPLMDKD